MFSALAGASNSVGANPKKQKGWVPVRIEHRRLAQQARDPPTEMVGDDPLHGKRDGKKHEEKELRVEQHYAPGAMSKARMSTVVSRGPPDALNERGVSLARSIW